MWWHNEKLQSAIAQDSTPRVLVATEKILPLRACIGQSDMNIKFDKKFQPVGVDEGDELFPNGIFEFNITKLVAYLKANPDRYPIEELLLESLRLWESSDLDDATVNNANIDNPIILAEISPGRFNVIDGNHRLAKARRDKAKCIRAYKVSPNLHYRFMTTVKGYQAYVVYWNSKVKDISRLSRLAAKLTRL